MKKATRLGAVCLIFLAIGPPQAAVAATLNVAGPYATLHTTTCQNIIQVNRRNVVQEISPIFVPGIGGIYKSTKTFIAALTPQSDTFVKSVDFTNKNTTSGQAIVSLPTTPGTAISDVGATSTVNFVTQVNRQLSQVVETVGPVLSGPTTPSTFTTQLGIITFPSTPSTSGNVSGSGIQVSGSSVAAVPVPGTTPVKRENWAFNATFALTATALNMTFGSQTETWDIQAGNINPKTGVAGTLYALRRPKSTEVCSDALTLTKQ